MDEKQMTMPLQADRQERRPWSSQRMLIPLAEHTKFEFAEYDSGWDLTDEKQGRRDKAAHSKVSKIIAEWFEKNCVALPKNGTRDYEISRIMGWLRDGPLPGLPRLYARLDDGSEQDAATQKAQGEAAVDESIKVEDLVKSLEAINSTLARINDTIVWLGQVTGRKE